MWLKAALIYVSDDFFPFVSFKLQELFTAEDLHLQKGAIPYTLSFSPGSSCQLITQQVTKDSLLSTFVPSDLHEESS